MCLIPEIEVLLQIVKGSLEVFFPENCNLQQLISISIRHKQIAPLLSFAQTHPVFFKPDQLKELESRTRQIALYSLQQLHEMKKLLGQIREIEIQCIPIKGPQLSRMIYGREALKDSVDLDLMLVNGNDLSVLHTLLTTAGYTRSNLNDYPGKLRRKLFLIAKREVSYFNPATRIAIDLHIRPGANTYLTEHRFDDFFKRLKPFDLEGTSVTVLSDEAYFVYLCYHGALHQFSRLAWLADIRAFLKLKSTSMDIQEIKDIAGKWRVTNCINLALGLIKAYFEEEYLPFSTESSWRMKFLVASCKKVLYYSPGYGITIPGRIHKTIYIQFLLDGLAARIDWFYGIVMRKGVLLLSKKPKLG